MVKVKFYYDGKYDVKKYKTVDNAMKKIKAHVSEGRNTAILEHENGSATSYNNRSFN